MRGSLHYAIHDEAVDRFGRDDGPLVVCLNGKSNGNDNDKSNDKSKCGGSSPFDFAQGQNDNFSLSSINFHFENVFRCLRWSCGRRG